MPELPEVEYTARQLRASVVGATISSALVFWERTVGQPDLSNFLQQVAGRRIEAVRRRGKFLILDLSGDLFLSIHRRMTGNLFLLPPGWEIDTSLRETDPLAWSRRGPSFVAAGSPSLRGTAGDHKGPPRHFSPPSPLRLGDFPLKDGDTAESVQNVDQSAVSDEETMYAYGRVCFNLDDGRRLLYTDPRKFGRIELWSRDCEAQTFKGLGPEPLDADFTVEWLEQALSRRKGAIKQALLAQEVVAGMGNIYADEALYYAAIHPLRRASSLTPAEIQLLHRGIVAALTLGIEHGGTSFNDYRDLWGEAGDNYNHVRVYQQDGKPCPRCGMLIERMVIAQRGTHFCPGCQKLTAE
jgi:formamidopyrimidine-DNA glycosylase